MEKPHLSLAKQYWTSFLSPRDLAIDATCGNGHDTLFLAGLCRVIGIDIQSQAIANTQKRLSEHQKQADLFLLSHAEIDQLSLPFPPKLIVYNLGYLPGGNKALTTTEQTTLKSVEKSLHLLKEGGALSITCYPGHDEGLKEQALLETWLEKLEGVTIQHHKWRERSPSLIWLIRNPFAIDQKRLC